MVFLNPAILIGLLAASIPVIIHLLNLRKLKKIEFSTLRFLKELQKNKIRKIRIKQWLLLALRVLIILLLVTAFARPTLEGVAVGGTTSAAKTTAVFILDDSFSMSVVDARGSYFNQAKEILYELTKNFQEGDEIALIRLSGSDNAKPSNNISGVIETIQQTEISGISGNIHDALIKAGQILTESKNFNKEIYILSDFQKSMFRDKSELPDLKDLFGSNIALYSVAFNEREVINTGISNLSVQTGIFQAGKPVTFKVNITNYTSAPVNNAVVSLFVDEERKVQQSFSLNGGASVSLELEALTDNPGFKNISAEIESDDIQPDNVRYTNLYIPQEIPVLFLSEDQKDQEFIELALLASDTENTLRISKRNVNQLAATNLNNYKVIILVTSGRISNTERLLSYVENGGGLIMFPSSDVSVDQYRILAEKLQIAGPVSAAGQKNRTGTSFRFGSSELDHPVFSDIFSANDKRNIESPDIYYYLKINPGGKGRSIISMEDGSAFLSDYSSGKGRILSFNVSPVLEWSDFPLKSIFAPLMYRAVFYLSASGIESSNFIAGEPVLLDLRKWNSPAIKIVNPEGFEIILNRTENSRDYSEFIETGYTGNYRVYDGEKLVRVFSVNHNPVESVVEYLSQTEFDEYLQGINFNGKHIRLSPNDSASEIIMQARFGSELWKIFLVLAFILLITEMIIARSARKDIAASEL